MITDLPAPVCASTLVRMIIVRNLTATPLEYCARRRRHYNRSFYTLLTFHLAESAFTVDAERVQVGQPIVFSSFSMPRAIGRSKLGLSCGHRPGQG
jgi:hypothetical protein